MGYGQSELFLGAAQLEREPLSVCIIRDAVAGKLQQSLETIREDQRKYEKRWYEKQLLKSIRLH